MGVPLIVSLHARPAFCTAKETKQEREGGLEALENTKVIPQTHGDISRV